MDDSNSGTKDGWKSLTDKLDFADNNGVDPKIRRRITLLRVGIASFLMIGASLTFKFVGEDYLVITNQSENAELHYLPDSSTVLLESNATIRYKIEKYKRNRKIELSGSAYLEIKGGDIFEISVNRLIVNTIMGSVRLDHSNEEVLLKPIRGKLVVKSRNKIKEVNAGEELRVKNEKFIL